MRMPIEGPRRARALTTKPKSIGTDARCINALRVIARSCVEGAVTPGAPPDPLADRVLGTDTVPTSDSTAAGSASQDSSTTNPGGDRINTDAAKDAFDMFTAWGQYTDSSGEFPAAEFAQQYGIYGTCAAIQILTLVDPDEYADQIQSAIPTLPMLSGDENEPCVQIHRYYQSKGDLDTTYKLAALLEVASVVSGTGQQVTGSEVTKQLLGVARPGGGWPDYRSQFRKHQESNVHATAVALMALSGTANITNKEDLAKVFAALTFISSQDLGEVSIASLSMLVIAMERFKATGVASELAHVNFDSTLSSCRNELLGWIAQTRPQEARRSLEGSDYRSPEVKDTSGAKRFQSLFYMPHCVAAIAVLSSDTLQRRFICREFVRQVVETYATDIIQKNKFAVGGRQRVSTVECMWVARLLREYLRARNDKGKFIDRLDVLRRTRTAAIIAGVVAFCIVLGIGAAATTGVPATVLNWVSAGLIATLTAVIVPLILDRYARL